MADKTLKPDRSGTADLIAQARGGDSRAFERLVDDYQLRVFRWALAFAIDGDEAEDITQEVFVLALRHIRSFRSEGPFDVWLYRITRRAASRLRRTRARRHVLGARPQAAPDRIVYETDPGSRVDRERMGAVLRKLWTELPEQQRCVIDLVDLQGHTPSEAAQMLDLNPSTLRANLFKARKSLKEKVLSRHPEIARDYFRSLP